MIIIPLADGFEEIEALTPLDMLRRAGLPVKTVAIGARCCPGGATVTGAHHVPVICDLVPEEVPMEQVDAVILPGGMPGAENLDASPFVDALLRQVSERGGRLAAICAAPLVLGRRGLLAGRRATCYPGFEAELHGATVVTDGVVTDGPITTARGMGVALPFAKELLTLLVGADTAARLSRAIMEEN